MSSASGPRPRRRGSRRLVALSCLVLAVVGGVVLLTWRDRREVSGAHDQLWQVPEPTPPGAIAWPAGTPDSVRSALTEATRQYAVGQIQAGDTAMSTVVETLARARIVPSESMGTHHLQSVTLAFAQKNFAEADRRAQRWLTLAPGDINHTFFLGQMRYQERRWSGALDCFLKIVEEQPRFVDAHRWLAQTCAQMGARDVGLQAVKASLDLVAFPDGEYWASPLGEKVLSNAIFVLHRFQDYEQLHVVAAAYRGRFAVKHEALMADGVALANLGRYAEAEPLLRQALAEPKNLANLDEISFELALCLTKSNQWPEATRFLAALLARNPFHAKAYHQLALAFDRLGRGAEGEAMRARSRELAPSERELRREKELRGAGQPGKGAAAASRGYALRGEYGRAEQALRSPDSRMDPYAVFALADFYLSILRSLDADQVLEHAATLVGSEHPDVVGRRGLGLLARGDSDRGFAALRTAAGATTESVWRLQLARELVLAGRGSESLPILLPLRQGDEDREASYWLGRARLEMGDAARAIAMLQSISTADTRFEEWEMGSWLALALLTQGEQIEAANRLLDAVPVDRRSSRAYLESRVKLLEARPGAAVDLESARKKLANYAAIAPGIRSTTVQVASTPWAESGGLRLALAKLHAARGELTEAIRQAQLSLLAAPGSLATWRLLASWLEDDSAAFLKLRALREALALAPNDAEVRAAVDAMESRWLK